MIVCFVRGERCGGRQTQFGRAIRSAHPFEKVGFFDGMCVSDSSIEKIGIEKAVFDCARMPNLVSARKPPFSIHRSDSIRIGLRAESGILTQSKQCRFDPNVSIERSNPHIPSKKQTLSTGCADRIARSIFFLKPTASLTTPQDTRSHHTTAPMLAWLLLCCSCCCCCCC